MRSVVARSVLLTLAVWTAQQKALVAFAAKQPRVERVFDELTRTKR